MTVMTHDDVLKVIQNAVATVLEVDPSLVTRDSHFVEDLAADSLALVEIAEIVEATLASPGFHIDDEDLSGLATVGDALDYALARL